MGYMIRYNPEQDDKYPSTAAVAGKKIWHIVLATLAVVVLLGAAVIHRDYLIRYFLPGDGEVATVALEELIKDFRSGAPLGEAITTFCREIIASAA